MSDDDSGLEVDASSNHHPILLFDGVCNLCDAAVQFVIDRDPEARFRFAALQSDAARDALETAGAPEDLPDSMVLIDERGLHTRSDAAIAVARRLGFPWSLAAIAQPIPRFLRDPLYAWIARNRYRWFGRQNACRMPTPDLRARFLDTDEPARPVLPEVADPGAEPTAVPGLGLGTVPGRFLLIYTVLFMLPFPLNFLTLLNPIPGYSDSFLAAVNAWLTGLPGQVTEPIIGWMGRVLTGETPSFEFTGSGDGLASYLGVLLNICLALAIAFGWWFRHRSKPISPPLADGVRVLLRYFLASVMFSYGFSKVFPLQFSALGPDRMLQTYGESSPMGLMWTFMGASPGYQMFAGAAEVIGGLLLLFRRTTLLGALIIAAVMTNVFAMNMFFDVPVKVHSFHYLVLALYLVLPDAPRLFGTLIANVPVAARDIRPFWHASRPWRRALGVTKIVLIAGMLIVNIDSGVKSMRTWGLWAPQSDLRGMYRVESFEVVESLEEDSSEADSSEAEAPETQSSNPGVSQPPPDAVRWVRMGLNAPRSAAIQYADGTVKRFRLRLDEEASTFGLLARGMSESDSEPLSMERLGDEQLRLSGDFEGESIDVVLSRNENEGLFSTRGFRWVNEVPFNR